MDINHHVLLKNRLACTIGNEKLKNMTDEITQIIVKNNLDVTPAILSEAFDYIKESILLSRI